MSKHQNSSNRSICKLFKLIKHQQQPQQQQQQQQQQLTKQPLTFDRQAKNGKKVNWIFSRCEKNKNFETVEAPLILAYNVW